MEMCYDGALVMPSSYAVMSEEGMTYVEGGKFFSGAYCRQIVLALGCASGGVLMSLATGAAIISKLIRYAKFAGGLIGWAINLVVGITVSAVGKIAYGIGYGAATNRGVHISPSPAPWESFVSVSF